MSLIARNRSPSGATRRQPVDPAAGQRRRRRWTAFLMLLMLTAAGSWAVQRFLEPGRFPLRHVHFQGELQYLDTAELHTLAADQLGQNFFLLDLTSLRDRLLTHPWIGDAVLRRDWPDSLEVRLTERRPYAYWGDTDLIDGAGRPFRPSTLPSHRDWPRLHGPDGQGQQVIARHREFSALLAPLDLHIERLIQDSRGAWSAQLTNGLELDLGQSDLGARLGRFIALYPGALQARLAEIAAVDLRYRNGAALRWLELPDGAESLAHAGGTAGILQQAHSRPADAGRDNG
jgi:cell division protein FtsQ